MNPKKNQPKSSSKNHFPEIPGFPGFFSAVHRLSGATPLAHRHSPLPPAMRCGKCRFECPFSHSDLRRCSMIQWGKE